MKDEFKTRTRRLMVAVAISGGLLVSTALADNAPSAIYVMKVDGSQVRKLAADPDHDDHGSPRWSHDGKMVAFDASNGPRGNRDFLIVNFDGTGLRKLGSNARPDWSPDDKQLVYDVYSNKGLQIFVQNLDGEGRTELTHGVCARWSPDGGRLAVTDHKGLWTVDLASGEETQLFDEPFVELFAGFSWSPDGKWIALSARPKPNAPRHLILVSAEGEKQGRKVRLQSEQGGGISFSPDGKQLTFDDRWQIYTVSVDGTDKPRLVPGQKGKNKDPHWSPDGEWIVFSSDR